MIWFNLHVQIFRVIESVSDEPSVCSKLYNSFLPFRLYCHIYVIYNYYQSSYSYINVIILMFIFYRNCLRNIRRTMFRAKPNRDAGWFRTLKTVYFTVTPFIGASLLYFETIKEYSSFIFYNMLQCCLLSYYY